jgi:amidohydrolase
MSLLEEIKERSEQLHQDTIETRRHLHMHPELSFQEYETSKFIKQKLEEIGINDIEQKADTGWVALIKGKNPANKSVALRADFDALPITETNDIDYKSKNVGVMHACGHDVHTASLITSAKILNDLKEHFNGTVKLIFQPGEEKAPGGASIMIREGALENPRPDAILGQHVMPFIPAGKIGFRTGKYMASADELYITVKGKGGHGAVPEKTVDPVVIAAQLITALQQLISRNCSPKNPSVLTIGKVIADGATNVIPNQVYMEGTFRALDEEWRSYAHKRIEELVYSLTKGMGGDATLEIRKGYPYLENQPALTNRSRQAAEVFLGKENVVDLDLWMAGEDFAFYTHHVDGCFYRLGTGNEAKGTTHSVHTPNFNIDEDALKLSPGLMVWLALEELKHRQM